MSANINRFGVFYKPPALENLGTLLGRAGIWLLLAEWKRIFRMLTVVLYTLITSTMTLARLPLTCALDFFYHKLSKPGFNQQNIRYDELPDQPSHKKRNRNDAVRLNDSLLKTCVAVEQ